MKIAYFLGTLVKDDGVARVVIALINEAQKHGIDCIIVTGWAEDTNISPVSIIQVPSVKFPLYKEYRLSLPGTRGFKNKLDEFRPDIIHINSPDTIAWAALKYAKKNNIPIIATHHSDFIRYLSYYHLAFLKPLVWYLLKKLYSQMKFTTTPSTVTTNDLTNHNINNVYTIPWGVDFSLFDISFRSQAWREKFLKNENKKIILCVCRLTWEKDLKTLAKTYELLKSHRDDFIMVIVGDGPIRKELEMLMPKTIFLGHTEKKELSQIYASSDILLFPSSTETFGMITIEAMASGVVPIVANAGGSKTIVKDGENGFLAQPKSPEDFYKKTVTLLDNPQLLKKMRENGLNFVKNFSWEKVFDEFFKKYSSLIKHEEL